MKERKEDEEALSAGKKMQHEHENDARHRQEVLNAVREDDEVAVSDDELLEIGTLPNGERSERSSGVDRV